MGKSMVSGHGSPTDENPSNINEKFGFADIALKPTETLSNINGHLRFHALALNPMKTIIYQMVMTFCFLLGMFLFVGTVFFHEGLAEGPPKMGLPGGHNLS